MLRDTLTAQPRGDVPVAGSGSPTFGAEFARLCSLYAGTPLKVSFRDLVGPLPADEGPHRIHPYPARLVRQLPRFFLGTEELVPDDSVVYDPFCGSGTVLVEAMAYGSRAWGTDANPLAALLTRVKVTPVASTELETLTLRVLRSAAAQTRMTREPDTFLSRWFDQTSLTEFEAIRRAIARHASNEAHADALRVALSLTADRLAHKDRRIPVPVRQNGELPKRSRAEVRAAFDASMRHVIRRLPVVTAGPRATVHNVRAQECAALVASGRSPSPTMVLTSPPYGAAQKYIRSSSISMAVLGLAKSRDFQQINSQITGREWLGPKTHVPELSPRLLQIPGLSEILDKIGTLNPSRQAIYSCYFADMWKALEASANILRPGGHYVLVASSNTVAGIELQTHEILAAMMQELGLTRILSLEDRIAGRALMTRRASTASGPIQSEVVHVMRKPAND